MLLNHTAHLHSDNEAIDELVGTSFSLLTKIQMGGTGSEKMQILACSRYFQEALNKHQQTNYGSLEIRTRGIILHFNNGKSYYVWCVPYYRLSIYQTDTLSIHGEGRVVKFKLDKNKNKSFMRNLLSRMSEYQRRYEIPPLRELNS